MKHLTLLLASFFFCIGIFAQDAAELVSQGQKQLEMGQNDEALNLYNKAIQTDPEYLDAYLKRAFVYSIQEKHQLAIQDYDKIIELNPKNSYMYVSRGSAYNKLKQYQKAIEDFNKAIEIDENNTQAYNNRGWAKKALGDKEGACDDWKKSKKMGNEEAKIILKNNQC
ncbi:MAG: tetratricopeptide repeat protein [Flavobacteriales bacterium]